MMDIDEIRTFIVETRKARGMTQKELAKEVGIACNTLASFESGTRCTSAETLTYILYALGYELDIKPCTARSCFPRQF